MAYDSNWLKKARAKAINADLSTLTHVSVDGKSTACGMAHNNGRVLMVSFGSTPTCATCRANTSSNSNSL